MFTIRRAEVHDVPQIVTVLRNGVPERLLPYTILGCRGIGKFLEDTITRDERSPKTSYLVCVSRNDLVGIAEIRTTSKLLFLNHIYVTTPLHGQGLGTRLLREVLRSAGNPDQKSIQLDVFAERLAARTWYESLGFSTLYEQVWLEMPLAKCRDHQPSTANGLAEAQQIHRAYDFSEFSLSTRMRSYRVGRLADRLFRVTDGRILTDASALEALATLDPHRNLLCIAQADTVAHVAATQKIVKAGSLRMAADSAGALGRLLDSKQKLGA